MACQTTTGGVLLWRALTGVGIGVELVTIDTYITELMPKHLRGRAFAINQVVQFSAVPFVAFIAWVLVPRTPLGVDGWRWVVLIGSASAIVVWFIRRVIPESPRWLIARGRLDEAERGDRDDRAARRPVSPAARCRRRSPSRCARPAVRSTSSTSFAPRIGSRTLMLMVFNFAQTVGYYGFASWVPTLLMAAGITTTASLGYSFAIALSAPVGPLLIARFADGMDRKWQIVWSASAIAVLGLLFARQTAAAGLVVFGVLLTCVNNWMSVAFHAYQSELFPTRVRAQAVGFVYSWSRFSAIFTSLMIGFLLNHFGVNGVFVFIAVAMLVAAVSIGTVRTAHQRAGAGSDCATDAARQMRNGCPVADRGLSERSRHHRWRRLNPESRLTRVPTLDGTTAMFTGMLSAPVRNVMPVASTRPVPSGVTFGPRPNSAPSRVRTPTIQLRLGSTRLRSSPPTNATHSVTIVTPLSLV